MVVVDKPIKSAVKSSNKPYMETDVDTMESRDISVRDGAIQGEGDWQTPPPADSAGLRRTTAIDNISSATYNPSSSMPHTDHSESLHQVQPEMGRQNATQTYRDGDGTLEMGHRHVPRTHRDDDRTSEIERQNVPRTHRDDDRTSEIERQNVPRMYRNDDGTSEIERQHVPRTYRDDDRTSEIERQHVPRTYRDDDKPAPPQGSYSPETERRHVPRTYNRTASPFGNDPRPRSALEQRYEPQGYMNGDSAPPAGRDLYRPTSEDHMASSKWQPSQTQDWQNTVSYLK